MSNTIKIENLTFPTGEFSHTELAEFNKLDRKKVWTAYQKAIADGIIKSSGNERKSGKGKAAALWIVSDTSKVKMSTDSVPVPVIVTPAVPIAADLVAAKPGRKPKSKNKPANKPAETPATVPATTETAAPAAAPFTTEMDGPVENTGGATLVEPATAPVVVVEIKTETIPTVDDLKPIVMPAGVSLDIQSTDEKCPLCQTPLVQATQSNGIRIWCPQQNRPGICSSHESPFGFGKNVKSAYETLCQKYCRQPNEA